MTVMEAIQTRRSVRRYDSRPVEEGTLGDLVRWNGALWLLVGVVDDEMWLAPLAGVLRRPVLVQPEDGVLDGFITHRAPNNG